jgi:ABC-type Fe3+-siderophore transport system permease subunit
LLAHSTGSRRAFSIYVCVLIALAISYLLPPSLPITDIEKYILLQLKLPVLLTALGVGASVAGASAALQVLLRNPLADPGIIGISSGASLFAAAFILLSGTQIGSVLFSSTSQSSDWHLGIYMLPLLCFVGALLSSFLIFTLARWMGGAVSSVILSGIAISTLCSALVGWMFLLAPPKQLQTLSFWLMGSLDNTTWASLAVTLPLILICMGLLFTKRSTFNKLYLGEQAAQLSGVNIKKFQSQALIIIALLVGVSVSIAGSIAFLGLLIPHFIRQVHGNDNRIVIPLSAIAGACVMLLCALINSALTNVSLPISMLTASIGAPLFIYVLSRRAFS